MSLPGGPVYRAYDAALHHADAGALERFLSAFKRGADKDHVRRHIWPKVVEHVTKYTRGPGDASFVACRIERKSRDRIRLYVHSRDPRKSDPPIVLVREGTEWRIDVLTP